MNNIREKLFSYENYREFLKDFFEEQKKLKKIFSYRYFASKSGFSSASFLVYILKGERNLSFKSIQKILKGLDLEGKSAKYFESLVLYNQTTSSAEKKEHFENLKKLRKNTKFAKLNKTQYSLYDEWYFQVIRELVVLSDWNGDYKRLGKLVRPSITSSQAKNAVEKLEKIGLIKKEKNIYIQIEESITAIGTPAFIIKKTRAELIQKGAEATELMTPKERYIAGTTLSVGARSYDKITKLLDEVRDNISKIAMQEDSKNIEKVYQLNLQIFPMSQNIK